MTNGRGQMKAGETHKKKEWLRWLLIKAINYPFFSFSHVAMAFFSRRVFFLSSEMTCLTSRRRKKKKNCKMKPQKGSTIILSPKNEGRASAGQRKKVEMFLVCVFEEYDVCAKIRAVISRLAKCGAFQMRVQKKEERKRRIPPTSPKK